MRVYLDMSILKRPWDEQSQPRIADETGSMLVILSLMNQRAVTLLHSPAHVVENATNPDKKRAATVARWLGNNPLPSSTPESLHARSKQFRRAGLHELDALHLAWAEGLEADLFVTTDDRLHKKAAKTVFLGALKVTGPADAVTEILRWRERK